MGLPLDGPAELHDLNRRDNQGKRTHDRIMKTVRLLEKYHVEFNILCVVTGKDAKSIQRIYQFYKKQNFLWLQVIPCLEPLEQERGSEQYHLSVQNYGDFLIRIFDLWYQDLQKGEYVSIRHLDNCPALLCSKKRDGIIPLWNLPERGRETMSKKVRKILMVALALVFVGSVAMLIRQNIHYKLGEEVYAEAETLVELPDFSQLPAPEPSIPEETPEESEPAEEQPVYIDPYADALRNMDFTALREVNSDVLGWIVIPGTPISYPLLQGTDNNYYLKHTWKKASSVVGSIYLEYQNSGDLSDFNTVVYGHRMNNGSMFASLKYFKDQSYWKQHPYVYITDDRGTRTYEIFSAYEAPVDGDTYYLSFPEGEDRQAFIDYCLEQSAINTGIVPQTYDHILTLSTCTGRGYATRWVVQAVLRGEAPAEEPAEEAPAEEAAAEVPEAEAA